MIIGFTGTQKGMTAKQAMSLGLLIIKLKPLEFHHGDCIGADEQAHREVRLHSPKTEIVGHPPLFQNKRAFCKFDREWHPADYLVRNREIVQCSDQLIATPAEFTMQLRSGTWSTVRRAQALRLKTYIIMPDGEVT